MQAFILALSLVSRMKSGGALVGETMLTLNGDALTLNGDAVTLIF